MITSNIAIAKMRSPLKGRIKRTLGDPDESQCSNEYYLKVRRIISNAKKYIPTLTRDEIIERFGLFNEESMRNGIRCCYFQKLLKYKSQTCYPWKDVGSIDHMKPQHEGGSNTLDNLVLSCHQCNIVKGTMNSDTFLEMFEAFEKTGKGKEGVDSSKNLKQRFLDEVWASRLANKIERVNYDLKLKKEREQKEKEKEKEEEI
jgi:5-methylcytosine-specific restriction endonuclease McrA